MDQRPSECPLTAAQQTRNIVLYSLIWGMVYFAAPILYVGLVQAALFERLGQSKSAANLPSSVSLWMSPAAVLITWLLPSVSSLKKVVATCYLIAAAGAVFVVVALLLRDPLLIAPAVVLHAGLLGATNGTAVAFLWEILARGVSYDRRGQAFSLAFGPGAMMAVAGSFAAQLLLQHEFTGDVWGELGFRLNFALLYAAIVPLLVLAALFATLMIVPLPQTEAKREPFLQAIFGGFGDFLRHRLILLTVIGYGLVYAGYNIMPTITLFTQSAAGVSSQELVGYQQMLRFGFKVGAGLFLGWLLTRTYPRLPLLITASLCAAGVVTALLAPGRWFLLSFGLLGAGELFGLYFPNYVLCCSAPAKMRRNMALCALVLLPCGFSPLVYGWIIDAFPQSHERQGFQAAFALSLALIGSGIGLTLCKLPRRPG